MSYAQEKQIKLKDGSACTIRTAMPKDSGKIVRFREDMAANSAYLINIPGENKRSSWRERGLLKHALKADNLITLVAEQNDEIIGFLDTNCFNRKRTRHVLEFGIGISQKARNLGLGKLLIQTMIDWARQNEVIEKIELHVHDENEHAIALYKSLGFEVEGCRKKAIKYENGEYMDDFIMGLVL
jgi:ribosomal protein S18 acetylase RimI-like enzyme